MPAVAVRAGCGTEVKVVRALGWVRKAQPASRKRETEVTQVGA